MTYLPMHIIIIAMKLSLLYFKGSHVEIHVCPWTLFLSLQTIQTLKKRRTVWHFIKVFTVCQRACLYRMKMVTQKRYKKNNLFYFRIMLF